MNQLQKDSIEYVIRNASEVIEEMSRLRAELERVKAKRMFPIQRGPSVPWEVMAPHEDMAKRNHQQSLEKLAERGGLSSGEAWCVVNGIDPFAKEEWTKWDAAWRMFAERVNLHYAELERVKEECATQRAEAIRKAAETIEARKELERIKADVKPLVEALSTIARHTNPDDESSYRSDDREGCLDTVHHLGVQSCEHAKAKGLL